MIKESVRELIDALERASFKLDSLIDYFKNTKLW
jgi:hypothetical protein